MEQIRIHPIGLAEPISVTIGSVITAGTTINNLISNYNASVEQDRANAVAEWDAKRMEAREYRERVLQPQYEEAEMNLLLQEYQELQKGLRGLGSIGYSTPKQISNNNNRLIYAGIGVGLLVISTVLLAKNRKI